MNLIILNDTEHMRDIIIALATVPDQTIVFAQTDKPIHEERVPLKALIRDIELPIGAVRELEPINVKRIKAETGTSKQHFSHRSKFHTKRV